MKKTFIAGLVVALLLTIAPYVQAQTALDTTTLNGAIDATQRTFDLTSGAGVSVGDLLVIDREAMEVRAISSNTVTVNRGYRGAAVPHVTLSLVYHGEKNRFYQSAPVGGGCTRASELYLPRVVLSNQNGGYIGDVWDCPVGAGVWTLLNSPATHTTRSEAFNLDNGAAATIDAVLMRPARAVRITACRIVYEDATTGTVAAGSAQVGTTVGGTEIVAATNYENAKAVGTTTAMVVVSGAVAAGTPVLVRHTGVAVTQAGEAVVECDWHYR